jgi:hypothetical protein
MKRSILVSILILLFTLAGAMAAQRGPAVPVPAASGSTAKAVTAANAFLAMLDSGERAKSAFPFNSPQKTNWSDMRNGEGIIRLRASARIRITGQSRDTLQNEFKMDYKITDH